MPDPSEPPAVYQSAVNQRDHSDDCPFCTISRAYQPINPQDLSNEDWDPDKLAPPSYVLLSTEHVIAFLDIAPLSRGHVLVAPRKHRVKMGDLRPTEMAEIGKLLPLIARSVTKSVLTDIPHDEVDYNIVQNNGPGAAQVIPHVHFHIIPRPPLNYVPPPRNSTPTSPPPTTTTTTTTPQPPTKQRKYPASTLPTGLQKSYIQFGRGQRHELDDNDAGDLIGVMRANVLAEHVVEQQQQQQQRRPSPGSTKTETETETEADDGRRRSSASENRKEGDDSVGGTTAAATTTTTTTRGIMGLEDAAWIEGGGGLVRNLLRSKALAREEKL